MFPKRYENSHTLCFVIHDIMLQLLDSGMAADVFTQAIKVDNDEEISELEGSVDILDWLHNHERHEERAQVLKSTVLPAVLSDMLHCIYEALVSSKKRKMAISYMLLRKPIQESLYLLESIIIDEDKFVSMLSENPLKLRPKNGGGPEGHSKRIEKVLEKIGVQDLLDPEYIASLRYDKNVEDSFDRTCNHAMHLFTEHEAIKTEKMNINFIFSTEKSIETQRDYLYSRLPYLLYYIYLIVEYIMDSIAPTSGDYFMDMHRRISAGLIISYAETNERYKTSQMEKLASGLFTWLYFHSKEHGFEDPISDHIHDIFKFGAFPNESEESIEQRNQAFITGFEEAKSRKHEKSA